VSPTAKRWLSRIWLLALLVLTFWARSYNRAEIFHEDGRIYFIEGDCYSRMERARMVTEGHWVIRHHDFENWPQGTTPHTTAPMDWLIVAIKVGCDGVMAVVDHQGTNGLHAQTLDLAGALVSPILGLLTAAWLWWWAGWMRLRYRGAMVFFFAVSPILVHGTLLGRPDHQSLLMFLIAIAVAAELALADFRMSARLARRWSLVAGLAWGAALWVSLYEPAVFLAGAVGWHLLANRSALTARATRSRWIALGAVLLAALLIDGFRLSLPDQTLRQYFIPWSHTIGELKGLSLAQGLVWKWLGLFWITAPGLLWLAGKEDVRARGLLPLLGAMLLLTMWQLRWGYFIALAVTISLPWQLAAIRRAWLGWLAAIVAMAPLLWGWSDLLKPDEEKRAKKSEDYITQEAYREVAEQMRGPERKPFLAAWWVSPQIAYWSGQPGVAGTSHQSLPGIVDTARFLLAPTPDEAAPILKARGVRWIVLDDAPIVNARTANQETEEYSAVNNAANILSQPLPSAPMGWMLCKSGRFAPPYLHFVTPEERGLVLVARRVDGTPIVDRTRLNLPQRLKLYEVLPDQL
jgi:hypothetical protein